MRTIVCLGGGWQQLDTIQSFINFGFLSIVVDPNEVSECRFLATEYVKEDIRNYDAIYAKIMKFSLNYDIFDVIAVNNEVGLLSELKLKEKFGIKIRNLSLKTSLSNKMELSNWLTKQYATTPYIGVLEKNDSNANFLHNLSRKEKLVVKPVDSSGSRGVFFVDCETSINQIKDKLQISFESSNNKKLLIDRFIKGVEYSVEVVNTEKRGVEIICISKRHMCGFQSARGIETISEISDVAISISDFIKKFVKDVGHQNGLLHIELIQDFYNNIYIIDVGERGGGYWVADKLAFLKAGININTYIILLRHEVNVPSLIINKKNYLLKYVYPNEVSCINLDFFKLIDEIKLQPNELLSDNTCDSSRCGIQLYERI